MKSNLVKLLKSVVRRLNASLVPKGQMSKRDGIGRWVITLSSLPSTKTILEIGVWNGLGTSMLIIQGVKLRNSELPRIWGLESNLKMYQIARKNLSQYKYYNLIFGSVVKESELSVDALSGDESKWLDSDIQSLREAPYIFEELPEKIDLLILDGGEFSTYGEFLKLVDRVRSWIILDDTQTRKCKQVVEDLKLNQNFQQVWASSERNGVAVYFRIPSSI